MRPIRGKSARGRPRNIVGRINKQQEQKNDDDDQKKLTGPLKKRPLLTKKITASQAKKSEERELMKIKPSKNTMAATRARRTPKPNPRYSNDNIISLSLNTSGVSKRRKMYFSEDDNDNDDDEDDDILREDDDDHTIDSESMLGLTADEESTDSEAMDPDPLPKVVKTSPMGKRRGRPPKIPRLEISEEIREKSDSQRKVLSTHSRKIKSTTDKLDEKCLIARNRRLNIEFYDANESDGSISLVPVREALRSQKSNKRSSESPPLKPVQKLQKQEKNEKLKKVYSIEDDLNITTGAAPTIDDFETMPTFTIVNINDIINKKGDVLIAKSTPLSSWPQDKPQTANNSDEDLEKVDESQHNIKESSLQISRNRRKSMHTTILSDKIDQSKLTVPPPKSPFPLRKPPSIINDSKSINSVSKTSINSGDTYKMAPRILNSFIAKKTRPIASVIKFEAKDRKTDVDDVVLGHQNQAKENLHLNTASSNNNNSNKSNNINNNNNNSNKPNNNNSSNNNNKNINNISSNNINIRSISKNNITNSNNTTIINSNNNNNSNIVNKTITITSNTTNNICTANNNKIKKLIQRSPPQREIKKVTYIETWTVVEMPNSTAKEPPGPKPSLILSLIRLGNNIKEVALPTTAWSYRVALQKLPYPPDVNEYYTGETPKLKIRDSEKGMLQPVNIMFRRKCRDKNPKFQFDRSVTFRNNTYYINIDGKNVNLVCAPNIISHMCEIEILLQILESMTLEHPFVEETKFTYI